MRDDSAAAFGKTPRARTGNCAVRRAAQKRRNKLRHRKACRG